MHSTVTAYFTLVVIIESILFGRFGFSISPGINVRHDFAAIPLAR